MEQRQSIHDVPRPIASVAIIGAGVMGRGIAAANIERGIPVMLADIDASTAQSSVEMVLQDLKHGVPLPPCGGGLGWGGKQSPALTTDHAPIHACTFESMYDADLVIEAVPEKLAIKQQVLARVEQQVPSDALLASNTSSISITKIAAGLAHPERFCGLHFCHPVRIRPLVEVVAGEQTSDATVAAAVAYVRSLGKLPIVVKDRPGFLVNRLLTTYLNEAIELVLDGASIGMVEACAREFGMPIGPLRQFDEYGIDVAVRTGAMLCAAYPDRMAGSELPIALYQSGRLGRKTQSGFFAYTSGRPFDADDVGTFDDEVRRLIDEHRRDQRTLTPREITQRLFFPMLLEATRALDEQVVGDAVAVDAALQGGLGFISPYGGLLRWADVQRAETLVAELEQFASIGKRYEPTPMLRRMAADGRGFYEMPARVSHPAGVRTRAA